MRKSFDDASIEKLVRGFYEQIRGDDILGPIFARRIKDWEPHLQRMMLFWTTVLRGEAGYQPGPKGPPPALHRGIAELRSAHFVRWLSLFAQEAKRVFPADAASFVVARSEGMGRALSAHLQPEN
jgi:hemoglobin